MTLNRRSFLASTAAAGAVSLLPMPAIAQTLSGSGEVVVSDGGGAWGEAKRIAYFEPFEAETGIRVIAEPVTEAAAVRASIGAGAPRYDVNIINAGNIITFARDGLLEKLDTAYFRAEDLAGFEAVKPTEFSVPHILYTLLLAYDPTAFSGAAPTSWADFWDTNKFPGGRSLGPGALGDVAATFEVALLADGVPPDQLYPLDFDRALASLSRIKGDIVKFWESGAEGPQLITDKQVVLSSAWNGRVAAAQEQGAEIAFTWNQGLLQYDSWGILKGAQNPENAAKFIAFASRAENQAKFVEHILYAPPNGRAYDFIPAERAKLLPTAPQNVSQQVVQDYNFWSSLRDDGKTQLQYAAEQWEVWLVS